MRWTLASLGLMLGGCAQVFGLDVTSRPDTSTATPDAAPDAALGSMANPAASCVELLANVGPTSGVYWVAGTGDPFEVYCDQETNGGGWALLFNSVQTAGQTTAFWQIPYAERLNRKATPTPTDNFYDGSLYVIGTSYMDVLVDLDGKLAVAAVMTATSIDTATMRFNQPTLVVGNNDVFTNQFASGWAAPDYDGDTFTGACSTVYNNVTQHYSACWSYNLGSDADDPLLDGGVGPHAANVVATALGLALQPGAGAYTQLTRIARFVRW